MDKLTKGIIIGGIAGGIAGSIIANQNKLSLTEQEIARRQLSKMSDEELCSELKWQREEEEAQNTSNFWALMVIGCFIFPWVCVPVCLIGATAAVIKAPPPPPPPPPPPRKPMTPGVKWFVGITVGAIIMVAILINIRDRNHEALPKEGYCHAPDVSSRDSNGKCWIIKK